MILQHLVESDSTRQVALGTVLATTIGQPPVQSLIVQITVALLVKALHSLNERRKRRRAKKDVGVSEIAR